MALNVIFRKVGILKNLIMKQVNLHFYCFLHNFMCSYMVLMRSVENCNVKSHEAEREMFNS